MKNKHRAITDEQKEQRRSVIIETTALLFTTKSYNAISMAEVAKAAGVAKGTLFLYFATKEELFLALAWQGYEAFFREFTLQLKKHSKIESDCSVDQFIAILRVAFIADANLLRLMGIVSVILEQNINFEVAFKFKSMLAHQVKETSILLGKIFPEWHPGEAIAFLLKLQALAIGFQHLSEPSPVIREVISMEGFELFNIQFEDYFFSTLREIIVGIGRK